MGMLEVIKKALYDLGMENQNEVEKIAEAIFIALVVGGWALPQYR